MSDLTTKLGINIAEMKKGDYYAREQVEHAYHVLSPNLAEQLQRYANGELSSNPMGWACQNVIKAIAAMRVEMNLPPLVMRCPDGGIEVLTDAKAVTYLNEQANAGLRKHKNKTAQLFTHIDASQLDDHGKKSLEAHQRKHAFIAAAAQGARTQALRMQRKGLSLPDFKPNNDVK